MKQKQASSSVFTLILLLFLVNIGFSQDTITTYFEDFEEIVSLDLWRPNINEHADGTPVFGVLQSDGVLNVDVNQALFYDGQLFNFTENEDVIIDITENPYVSFDVKVEPGATYDGAEVDDVAFLVSPWGHNEAGEFKREFSALQINVPDDGEWHTVVFDISLHEGLLDFTGAVLENNYAETEAILIENVVWPGVYAFSMQFDNFNVGDVFVPVIPPTVTPPTVVTSYFEDFEETINLDLWRPNTREHADGTPVFDVFQADGVLNNNVSQADFFDGQLYNFWGHDSIIIDMTASPYISFDVKIEPGATYDGDEVDDVAFLVSPWGHNEAGEFKREFSALQINVPDDGEWHTVVFDISLQEGLLDFTGAILENNYSETEAVLIETIVWPGVYAFSMQFDNFRVGDAAAPIIPPTIVTSYFEDFEDEVSLDLWSPNSTEHEDGTPAFAVNQVDGVLNIDVNQVQFFDGQFYNFTKHENIIIDITDNPYISFDVKIEPGATLGDTEVDEVAFLVSPWGRYEDGYLAREFFPRKINIPDDGEWHTFFFDVSSLEGIVDFNGAILENNYSETEAVLIETVAWPDNHVFSMQFDNFRVGDAAAPIIPPTIVTSYFEDFEEEVSLDLWNPSTEEHEDGTPAFDINQTGGALNIEVNQVNFYDGQFFNFTEHENIIIDITENPYIAFDVKIEPGATLGSDDIDEVIFLVSPWGPNDDGELAREFRSILVNAPDDGEWHTLFFDISAQVDHSTICVAPLENNYSEIEAILIETIVWPDNHVFNMQFDNFRVGDAVDIVMATNKPTAPLFTSAFPNPVSDKLFLQAEEAIEMVRIFDVHGRLLSIQIVNELEAVTVDFLGFATGIYLVEARSANKISTSKIMKK